MNDLNLRVAALKLCAHPKRFAEMRGAPAPLPTSWQNSSVEYVQQFAAANSCTRQMAIVRQAFAQPEAFGFLADALFACPLKHPVRGVLTRLFSKMEVGRGGGKETHTKCSLIDALRGSLQQLAASIASDDVAVDRANDVIVSVGACLQNFPFGRDALAEEIHGFIPVLPVLLRRYWSAISHGSDANVELSPTRRNEFYLFIQNLLRFHVNFLTEFRAQLQPEQCGTLRDMDEVASCVARHMDTPWDVRSIAGLAIGHNARFFNDFDAYLARCQQMEAFEEIPIKAAFLLLLQKTDYVRYGAHALAILKRLLDQVQQAGNITNLLVYMSKHLYTYAKSLSLTDQQLEERDKITYDLILAILLRFSLEHLSSTVESIKHMCANLMQQVLQHAKDMGQTKITKQMYAQLERQRMPLHAICLMLQQLVEVMGTKTGLENFPDIFTDVFPLYIGLEDSVNALYKCMLTVAHKEDKFETWYDVWCMPLLRMALPCDDRLPGIERLIKVAVQLDAMVLPELLKLPGLPFSSKLTAMTTARRHGQQRLVQQLMIEHSAQIRTAIVGVDDNTRLMALCFIVETPRLSEAYTLFELDSIISYVQHNANNPSAHMRQIGGGLLQKALKRLELNLAQQIKAKANLGSDKHMLIRFLNTLMSTLALNLFPTANYGRRWLSMRLLNECIEMLERLGLPWSNRLPTQTISYLEHCLRDSYEHNKALAAQLLAKRKTTSLQPVNMMQLLLSLRPPDSMTGAYQLQVYCQAEHVEYPLESQQQQQQEELPQYSARHYAVLQWCLKELHAGVQQARVDFIKAATSNPLYGLLFASRHLLLQLQPDRMAEEQLWREYIEQLLALCLDVSALMLPVVGSDSPEGHVPMEQQQEQTEPQQAEMVPELDTLSITPQLVLLCAWRSIKEISLILGELVQRAPLQQLRQQEDEKQQQVEEQEQPSSSSSHYYLLSQQQVSDIGEHFLLLLAEIKHRGAFEQAYVGFTMLCRRFWHSDEPSLNRLPPIWLDEAMELIAGRDAGRKLCATRRSAGVPYMLQALICTELKLGTHNTFSRCMSLLLEVCELRQPGAAAAKARSHALNIMRALFRSSELSDLVSEFIERGVQCALESLLSTEWAERNCATLLLSALTVRIFGVERARNHVGQLHVRNRMTGRIFFTRYPKLFDYFHGCLRQAARDQVQEQQQLERKSGQTVQLEALLQLLSRLYPSALEGTECSLNLSEFVPFLQEICFVHDNMTRRRATQVLANFTDARMAVARIRRICMQLRVMLHREQKLGHFGNDLNGLHGHLLQLMEVYVIVRWQQPALTSMMVHTLALVALRIYEDCFYLFNAALNALIVILQDALDGKHLAEPLVAALKAIYALDHVRLYRRCEGNALPAVFFQVFSLHLHRLAARDNEEQQQQQQQQEIVDHMQRDLIEAKDLPPSIVAMKIDLWLYILFQQSNTSPHTRGLVENFELRHYKFDSDAIIYYYGLNPAALRQTLAQQLRESRPLQKHVQQLAQDVTAQPGWSPTLCGRLYCLLAMLDKLRPSLQQLLELSSSVDAHNLEPGLALCITRQAKSELASGTRQTDASKERQLWMRLLEYCAGIGAPSESPYLRYRATQLIDRITENVQRLLDTGDAQIVGLYMRLVLQLLVDESELVRNYMAEMVASSTCFNAGRRSEVSARHMLNVNMLPMVAETYFIRSMLEKLKDYVNDSNFILGVFNLIVEPFVSAELLEHRTEDQDEELEVFDKQETNVYCEGLRVASQVMKCFRSTYGANSEMVTALDALESVCSFSG